MGDQVSSLPSSSCQSPPVLVHEKQCELSLKQIIIKYCKKLKHIPLDFFRNLRVVESLEIVECPELLTDKRGSDLLPSTMVVLNIRSCGVLDLFLLGSLFHLNSLMVLVLEDCANITSLPSSEVFTQLKSLGTMVIGNCKNLVSLGGIDAVESLRELKITGCDKLVLVSSSEPDKTCNSSKISDLKIDHDTLLFVIPLQSLGSVETLRIGHVSAPLPEHWLLQNGSSLEIIEIYDASSLHYLPKSIVTFTSLWRLQICKAIKIESLNYLPTSLEELHICGCDQTLKMKLLNSVTGYLHIPYEEDIEITEEECGDQLFQPQNHETSSEDEKSNETEEKDSSEEDNDDENNGTSVRLLDDSSIMLAPSSSSPSATM